MSAPPDDLPQELRSERGRWERLARDPYYAVINDESYRGAVLQEGARERFENSGESDVRETLQEIRQWIEPLFRPAHGVDFGCGTGRLTIPLANACDVVTGVDISAAMVAEATRAAAERGVTNARFFTTEAFLAARHELPGVDFIHSYIVMQHIPPNAGLWLTRTLLERLAPGGIGALHYTFARRASSVRRFAHRVRRVIPGVNLAVNVLKGRTISEPLIPMYEYDLSELLALFGDAGCGHVHARLTDHGGHLGAMLIFRRG